MTYRLNFGQTITPITYVWYIEGLRERILVDAGASAQYFSTVRGVPASSIQTLESGLGKLGISFNDIDLVILTQLHHDHVSEAFRFTKAKFIVQQNELEFAKRPHPSVAAMYNREFFDKLDFEVINGDTQICDELWALSTPGHTPGGQSVSVKTAKGTAIIAGLCTILENYDPPSPMKGLMPVITPGIHTNVFEAYDSLIRIKEIADLIVPLHEPTFQQKSFIP